MSIINEVIDRFNIKSASMLFAFVLIISGIVMIILGIKDKGIIDIKMAILTGRLETGSIGLSLIFFSIILVLINTSIGNKPHKIKVKKNGIEINWEGQIRSSARMGEILCRLIKDISSNEAFANKSVERTGKT